MSESARPALKPVLIRKAGNALQVIPAHVAVLGPELTFTRRISKMGWQPDGKKAEYEDIQLYQISQHENIEGDFLFAPAGLLNRVISALKKWGISFQYEDVKPVDLGEPDWGAVDQCREGQDVVLAKIATCDMGQIEAPTGDGKTWIITQICKMYPNAKIVIVVASIAEARGLRSRLLEVLPDPQVGQLGGGKKQNDRRVTVCVKNSLMHADLENCNLLLFDECHTAGSDVTSKTLMHANNCKRFGFSATPEKRSDKADMAVEAIFGPVIHVTTYQESQSRGNVVPITVIMRSVPEGPTITSRNSTTVERNGIWRNKERNKRIAHDIAEFAGQGQMLVSTKVVEHGLEILRFSPEVPFVYVNMEKTLRKKYEREGVIKEGEHPITARDRDTMQDKFTSGELPQVLTTCWKRGVDFPGLRVLIRCDGSSSAIDNVQLPGRLSRTGDGTKSTGYLIDYLDEFNPLLHARAKRRMRDYRSKGWPIIMPKTIGST